MELHLVYVGLGREEIKTLMYLWKPVPAYLKDGGRGWGKQVHRATGAGSHELHISANILFYIINMCI